MLTNQMEEGLHRADHHAAPVGDKAFLDEQAEKSLDHDAGELRDVGVWPATSVSACARRVRGFRVSDVLRHHMVGLTGFEPATPCSKSRLCKALHSLSTMCSDLHELRRRASKDCHLLS
jgi:hypothetical protein